MSQTYRGLIRPISIRRQRKRVFISHSCRDHPLVCAIGDGLQRFGWDIIIDPFDPGDKTCLKVQEAIRQSTHFVLLNTVNSLKSRWVHLEALLAELCYDQDAICYVPVKVDDAPMRDEAEALISINWRSSGKTTDLVKLLADSIRATNTQHQLATNVSESEQLKENGRQLERMHYRTGDFEYNLKAIETYEAAILLNFCNHNAWANLAWCLWKQREDNRALKSILVAEEIGLTSNHVKDVKERILLGKRSMR